MNQQNNSGPKIPRHVGIIMDGNGRWARMRKAPRIMGHKNAIKAVRAAVTGCREAGVEVLTLYAFSTENWQRPKKEVEMLMRLFEEYLTKELKGLQKNDICLRILGRTDRLPSYLNGPLQTSLRETKDNKGMVLCLAVDYGGRDEIVRMVQSMAAVVKTGDLEPEAISEETICQKMDTAGLPDPDLIIRTSGEHRLSNFLLWQAAYAELYFTDLLWPDFTEAELHKAFTEFGLRDRRKGKVNA
ncbi:MAG: isoprenyl transferase [SAR324 cluster bacterium]|nr:isoprenyl transferase [SAR324 cluster bacterium]